MKPWISVLESRPKPYEIVWICYQDTCVGPGYSMYEEGETEPHWGWCSIEWDEDGFTYWWCPIVEGSSKPLRPPKTNYDEWKKLEKNQSRYRILTHRIEKEW